MERASTQTHEQTDKPDSPTDLTKPSWLYVVRKTVREFSDDQCTDLAAALTYYAVLALFPAAIAMISLVGLVGAGRRRPSTTILQILRDLGAAIGRRHPRAHPAASSASSQAAGLGAGPRLADRAVVGIGLRRRLRPRHEPRLRDRRGPPVLEAAPGHAPPHRS